MDARLLPIKTDQLKQLIMLTPIDSDDQPKLISRAFSSELAEIAYEQYTLLWKKMPENPYANLLRGFAAQEYWRYATYPSVKKLLLGSPKAQNIFAVAESCLAKAIKLRPDSARINMTYGFFLWQWDNQMIGGLAHIKRAIEIEPKNPTAHALLGNVYSNPMEKVYNLKKAEMELRLAVQLDASYAFPHWILSRIYISEKRYGEAQQELEMYLNLAPPSTKQQVKSLQDSISAGLHKK